MALFLNLLKEILTLNFTYDRLCSICAPSFLMSKIKTKNEIATKNVSKVNNVFTISLYLTELECDSCVDFAFEVKTFIENNEQEPTDGTVRCCFWRFFSADSKDNSKNTFPFSGVPYVTRVVPICTVSRGFKILHKYQGFQLPILPTFVELLTVYKVIQLNLCCH